MREGTGVDNLAEQFRRFAAGVRIDGAVRYARICEGIATDPSLLSLVAEAPPDQRRPNILLAAVHDRLLAGHDDPLAAHYPTVLAWRGEDPARALGPDLDPFPSFAAFCERDREAIAELVATRATQTNEVGRCTAILPALSCVAARAGGPIALVDLGAAAGLNLVFDRYAYAYTPATKGPRRFGAADAGCEAGDRDSPVVLRCEVRGAPIPTAIPAVAARVGLDRRPVDVRDEDQVRWLLACQWPDHLDRFEVARRAIGVARALDEPPLVRHGDALEDLDEIASTLPTDARLCVLHTWVAAYFTPDEQAALCDAVARLAATRPLSWVFAEAPYEVPALPVPPSPGGDGTKVRGATALVLVELEPGARRVAYRLADMHSHGRWVRWYGVAGGTTG
ncbi:MAG TPA: DUF2332 domain-containing protein [Acidimicrobiales bacterium]|nr:DUF2332 domain-containing protein [Acidimicrobiales bacterium]